MAERIDWRMWTDPLLGDVWILELQAGRIVGYAGPMFARAREFSFSPVCFERDPAFLRDITERFLRSRSMAG